MMKKSTLDHMAEVLRRELADNGDNQSLKFCRRLADAALDGFVEAASLNDWDEFEARKDERPRRRNSI
jgi:hypothetical protein